MRETDFAGYARRALIVAVGEYTDGRLRRLRAPSVDASRLDSVLSDPRIGGFDVRSLIDEPEHAIRRTVAAFLASGARDDLLLLHLSCHGVKDDDGHLYYAASDTEVANLDGTAISADWLNHQINKARSRRVVLILDCCHSGAFSSGGIARAGDSVDIGERFEGRGRTVLTASKSIEYAFEGDAVTGEGSPSVFTSAIVQGLETGAADLDEDARVSVDELYDYVFDRVSESTSKQTPGKWSYGMEGQLYIARNPIPPPVRPASLPAEIRDALTNTSVLVRVGVVQELGRLLNGGDASQVLAARLALETLSRDDSRRVSEDASRVLAAAEVDLVPSNPPEHSEPLSGAGGISMVSGERVETPQTSVAAPSGYFLDHLRTLTFQAFGGQNQHAHTAQIESIARCAEADEIPMFIVKANHGNLLMQGALVATNLALLYVGPMLVRTAPKSKRVQRFPYAELEQVSYGKGWSFPKLVVSTKGGSALTFKSLEPRTKADRLADFVASQVASERR